MVATTGRYRSLKALSNDFKTDSASCQYDDEHHSGNEKRQSDHSQVKLGCRFTCATI